MPLHENVRFFATTDVGRVREHNEDNYLIDKRLGLFIVADGMGGHAAGEIASALAVRTIHEEVRNDRAIVEGFGKPEGSVSARDILAMLEHAVQRASARIHEEAQSDPHKRGMGTTVSAMLLCGNTAFVAHVGDSRVYMLRDGKVHQLTEDHTVYNELVKRGKLSKEQIEKVAQKNAITRAVGVYERVEVDTLLLETIPGDSFLICSDGLHGYVDQEEELTPYLADAENDASRLLVDLANDRGGKDNVTAIVLRIGSQGADDGDRARKLALKREVLSQMPLFARLSDRELLRVMQVAAVRAYAAGTAVVREGERGDELYVVLSGQLAVSKGDSVLTHLGPGLHVGEMALIRNAPRSATVTAEVASELIVLRRSDFFEILRKEQALAVKMLWQFLGVLADRLDQTNRDLRSARDELKLEDLSQAVYALDMDEDPDGDRPTLPP
jgi:serine/threonine protein phosphatase PrpC/CRP-like cAMP-binding protein